MRMNLILWVALVGLIFCQSVSAMQTDPVCDERNFALKYTDWDGTATLPLFDPSLGVLTKVEIIATVHLQQDAGFEAVNAAAPTTMRTETGGYIEVTLPDSSIVEARAFEKRSTPITAYDGVLDYGGTSGINYSIDKYADKVQAITDSNALLAYIAPSPGATIDFPIFSTGYFSASGGGNVANYVNTK